jgi:oxygen-independent coproporphyrinogen-3 oxidase
MELHAMDRFTGPSVARFTGEQAMAALSDVLHVKPRDRNLLVYVHIPFCSSKCTFCDWVTDVPAAQLRELGDVQLRYAQALSEQMRYWGANVVRPFYRPSAVYWGGGTPSRLHEAAIETICESLNRHVLPATVDEYTIECSPETATPSKLAIFYAHGARRLSLGVQSFDDGELKSSGRAHRVPEVYQALNAAARVGFGNINIDLIVGLPGQTAQMLLHSVEMAVSCGVQHLSLYVYRAMQGTGLASRIQSGRKNIDDAQQILLNYEAARRLLSSHGFIEYSIGYFSRGPQLTCKADMYYYELEGDYIGFGAGAYSILANHYLQNHSSGRQRFIDDPTGSDVLERFSIDSLGRQFGSLSPTIGTPMGVSFSRFESLYGIAFDSVRDSPSVTSFLAFYEDCGAEFVFDADRLYVSEQTRTRAFVNATVRLAELLNQGRAARAVN